MSGETSRKRKLSPDSDTERASTSAEPAHDNNVENHAPSAQEVVPTVPAQANKVLPPVGLFWKLINSPIHQVYDTLNHVQLQTLMTTILNATKENLIFIPSANCSLAEYDAREEKYVAFTVWLLGRLFYLLGSDDLSQFHEMAIESQVKIIRRLECQRTHMFQPIADEYLLCLTDISHLQKPGNNVKQFPVSLKRFVPSVERIEDDDLDLRQVFIELKDESQCARLQVYILDILVKSLDGLLEFEPQTPNRVWLTICELLENARVNVKTRALSFSAAMLVKSGFCMHPDTQRKYLQCVQLMVEQDLYYQSSRPDHAQLPRDPMMSAIHEVFTAVNRLHGTTSARDNALVFNILAEILQGIKIKDSSDQLMETCGILARKLLVATNSPAEEHVVKRLIDNLPTCKHGMHVIEYSVLSELRPYTTPPPSAAPSDATSKVMCRDVSPTWRELSSRLKLHLDSPTSQPIASLQVIRSIVLCAARVNLELGKPESNVTFCFDIDVRQLLKLFMTTLLFVDVEDGAEQVVATLEIVGDLLWMAEVRQQTEQVAHTAVALMALPWLHANMWTDLETLNNEYIVQISRRLKHILTDKEVRKLCLSHVAFPICQLALGWRIKLLQSIIEGSDGALGAEAVHAVVKLLYDHVGELTLVVQSVLVPALESRHRLVQIALSEAVVKLICLLAGTCRYKRLMKDSHVNIEVCCTECDADTPLDSPPAARKQFLINESVLKIFLRLLTSPVPDVRRNVASALPRLSNHVLQFRDKRNQMPHKWIPFLRDDDQSVRLCFSKVVKYLVFNRRWMEEKKSMSETLREEHIPLSQYDRKELSQSVPLLEILNETLLATVQDSLEKGDKPLQESLLATLNEIGCVPVDCVLLPTISMMMLLIAYPSSSMAAAAKVCLASIAAAHNCSPRDMYVRYKTELCHLFVDMAVFNYVHAGYNFSTSLHFMARSLGLVGSREFVTNDIRTFLPHLVACVVKHPTAEPLLNDIAQILGITVSELIEDNYPYIYPHIYVYEEPEVIKSCCTFMEKLSNTSISHQKKLSLKVMSNELILHYNVRPERVLSGLVELIKEDPNFSIALQDKKSRTSLIADFLYPQFLGILVSFDSKLVTKVVCESVKRLALQTLPELIRLMGSKYITSVRLKVLATLRSALRLDYSNFPDLNCLAWEAFVRNVEIQALGPLLSTIFVSLMPLLQQFPREVAAIFNFLVVDHASVLSPHFIELYFVPHHRAITDVHALIQRAINDKGVASFTGTIRDMLKSVTHENIDVRLFGLRRLKCYLKNQQLLQKAICPYDTAETEVIELMDALISGCKDPDGDVRIECGECLGEIGAMDPGIIPWRISPPSKNSFPLDVKDEMFGFQALTQLCKAYQSARETQNMDSFSLAIQELLKLYELSANTESPKYEIWDKFPTQMKEIMTPLLTSCYKSISGMKKNWPTTIYGSSYSSSMSEWACCWAAKLISAIEDEFVQSVFSSCVFSFKRDLETLQFFLPYILLHTLTGGPLSARLSIIEELEAIMTDSCSASVNPEELTLLPVWTPSFSGFLRPSSFDTEKHVKISNTVYSLIDFLYRWQREYKAAKYLAKGSSYNPMADKTFASVHGFLSQINMLKIAAGNYETRNYQRALIYLEEYVTSDDPEAIQSELCFFAKIYARLDNPDMVAAVMALRTQEPSLEEMILTHEVTGQLQDAAACYERLADQEGLGPGFLRGMVQCYLGLDQPFTSLKIAEGIASERPDLAPTMHEAEAETFWRLQMFDELDQLLRLPELRHSQVWGVNVGKAMVAMKQNDSQALKLHLTDTRKALIHSLGVASLEEAAYQQGYQHIVRLYMLNEFETADQLVRDVLASKSQLSVCRLATDRLLSDWEHRLEYIQPSASVLEPVLCMRRSILTLVRELVRSEVPDLVPTLDAALGQCWVLSAEAARKAGYFQQAYNYVLKAEKYCPRKVFVEKAKLYWEKGEQDPAFLTLRRGLEKYESLASGSASRMDYFHTKENRLLNAEAKLLIATYNDKTLNVNMEVSVKNYKEAVEVCPTWEKSLVCLAQYYDRMLETMDDKEKDIKGGQLQVYMINQFGKSLQCGSVYLYQSMPRMLSIWLDYGTRLTEECKKSGRESLLRRKYMTPCLATMTLFIQKHFANIPAYMFLTAFSQILSRICHPQPLVFPTLKNLIINILSSYPQQALWMTMCIYKSNDSDREKKCKEIFADKRIKALGRLIPDFNSLAEMLIELTNKKLPDKAHKSNVTRILPALPRMLEHPNFSPIIMPVEQFRNIVLPPLNKTGDDLKIHNPLSKAMVYIRGIEDEFMILTSLQKPRKITLRGSDGNLYPIMCKPKDDLRRDFRLMEFNGIVNKYLLLDPHSRQRGLHIRTYSVVPLNEECGIIEWVPNLIGFRLILAKLYKDRSLYVNAHQYKEFILDVSESLIKKKKVFFEQLMPRHPPVFKEWFKETFTDPCSWYLARTSYIRTTAVMSMVGYIMGLGDRHGENILFDLTNGETVHVDFNCLFNKGEQFDWSEKVPFRLTHNMVSAMGPLGVAGSFRRSCEITMSVMRSQIATLMSVLRPFVYEPYLTDQGSARMSSKKYALKEDQNNAEKMNEKAVKNLANIESRLKGFIPKGKSALSVEGQVDALILEATDVNNLADMYIGWAPYM